MSYAWLLFQLSCVSNMLNENLHTDSLESALHWMLLARSHFAWLFSSIYLFCTRSSRFDFPSILLSHTTTAAAAAAASVGVFPHFFFALRFFSLHFFQWPVGMCACACVLSYAVITHQCHFERWKAHTSHSFSIPICHHKNPWPLSLFICRFGHLVGGKCFNSCNNFFPTEFVFPPVFCSRECVCATISYRW